VDVSTSIGFAGVGAIVFAYFANQQGWLNSDDWRFPTANLVGALLTSYRSGARGISRRS
jgi:hypothetical protein